MAEVEDVVRDLERERARWAAVDKPSRAPKLHKAPPATAVDKAVKAMPVPPPPSYLQFLKRHNGWENAWDGFDLLGVTGKHTDAAREDIAVSVKEETEALAKPPKGVNARELYTKKEDDNRDFVYLPNHVIFATNLNGRLGLFDRRTRGRDGEMEVALWSHTADVYERFPSFVAFLERALDDTRERIAAARDPGAGGTPAVDPAVLAERRAMLEAMNESIRETWAAAAAEKPPAPAKRPAKKSRAKKPPDGKKKKKG
jgi:hypothetical protein